MKGACQTAEYHTVGNQPDGKRPRQYFTGKTSAVCRSMRRKTGNQNRVLSDIMSLDKGIEHGKEWRRPYYGSSAFDRSCRPHGNCPWCYGNRMHSTRVRLLKGCSLDDEIEEPPKSDRAGEKSPAFCFTERRGAVRLCTGGTVRGASPDPFRRSVHAVSSTMFPPAG